MGCFRSSNVTFQHLKIEDCETHSPEGLIHIEDVDNVVMDGIQFLKNRNGMGPSCISGTNSSLVLRNLFAVGNTGRRGGILGIENCNITVNGGKFYMNSGYKGGTLFLLNCNLDVQGASFEENHSASLGGAIYIEVSCCFGA